MTSGIVYLVGAGPGDPGLLTLRARDIIRLADVLVYDNLVNDCLLDWCKSECQKVYVGKKPGSHAITQEEIERILVHHAKNGKVVARLKGGDPFIFGRGGEEVRRLAEDDIKFEIIPGVTAALAAAAYTGIPLTHRDFSSSISFLTGHENLENHEFRVSFHDFSKNSKTLCIYMGMGQLERITTELISGGLSSDTPVVVVQWATLPQQRSLLSTLSKVAVECSKKDFGPPSVIIVGEASKFYDKMGWFEKRQLFGKRIVVTRYLDQAAKLSYKLDAVGAEVIELPLIQIKRLNDQDTNKAIFSEFGAYNWIIFTSVNGVRYFFHNFFETFSDIRSFGALKIAVVGQETEKAINKYNLTVDFIPHISDSESLADELINFESIEHLKILVITGNRNRDLLVKKLEDALAIVDTFRVYTTRICDIIEHPATKSFCKKGADVVTFTSPSIVESFVNQVASLQVEKGAKNPISCSIGPITSESMRKAGIPVELESESRSIDGMVKAIIEKFNPI